MDEYPQTVDPRSLACGALDHENERIFDGNVGIGKPDALGKGAGHPGIAVCVLFRRESFRRQDHGAGGAVDAPLGVDEPLVPVDDPFTVGLILEALAPHVAAAAPWGGFRVEDVFALEVAALEEIDGVVPHVGPALQDGEVHRHPARIEGESSQCHGGDTHHQDLFHERIPFIMSGSLIPFSGFKKRFRR